MSAKGGSAANSDGRVQTLDTIKERIVTLRGLGLSWRKISALEEFGGSSAGMLVNIHNGYEPKTATTRKRLGLLPIYVPTEPCHDCGSVHTVPWCTEKHGQPAKPLKPPTKPRPKSRTNRATINTADMESAYKTISSKATPEQCRELGKMLLGE